MIVVERPGGYMGNTKSVFEILTSASFANCFETAAASTSANKAEPFLTEGITSSVGNCKFLRARGDARLTVSDHQHHTVAGREDRRPARPWPFWPDGVWQQPLAFDQPCRGAPPGDKRVSLQDATVSTDRATSCGNRLNRPTAAPAHLECTS